MNARKIACCILTATLAVAGAALAQDTKADAERAQRDAERAQRDAEEQMRQAQKQMREAERALQKATREMVERHVREARGLYDKRVAVFDDKARLGIVLRSQPDPKNDGIGATVQALTPGGPAEDAGLMAGDIIMKFNGEVLGLPGGIRAEDAPSPTDRLMERAKTLKDGDQVTLEVKRGDAIKTLTVTARTLYGPRVKVFTLPEMPDNDFDVDVDVEPYVAENLAKELAWLPFESSLRGFEMVTLNEGLGEYFGTKEGILVVKVPDDSPFQLKAGDVILRIGDRTPSSPAQAMRIMRSYAPGETVPLEVMRQHKPMTVSALIPQRMKSLGYRYSAPVAPPAPPEAPAAPAPPAPPRGSSRSSV